ncbi:MAG TPA: alpha/beta hydrolase [Solirubrobacteraceae bacterium]|nr:alpha/beta hydrolase [Solirubrobacteraceae bacterium]
MSVREAPPMRLRLRLYHHHDGARVAYREAGAGPPLVLLHAALLSHREWEPVVAPLAERHRVVIPDLPLHGDSEDRPRHPYTLDWLAEVMAGFAEDVLGQKPLVVGHDAGAEIALRAIGAGLLAPSRLVLMPNRLHLPAQRSGARRAWRAVTLGGAVPGLDRALSHATRLVFTPKLGVRLSERGSADAGDLMRHAFADVPGNPNLARSWAKCARRWPQGKQTQLLELYPRLSMPVLLLWADRDRLHPLASAEATLPLLPRGQLRVLPSTGFLMTYDDPVGVAREIVAFCR